MRRVIRPFRLLLLLFAGLQSFAASAADHDAAEVIESYREAVYQIRIIDIASSHKSTIGSGFWLGEPAVLVSNYHVISSAIATPDKYRIEAIDDAGVVHDVALVDVDVVNDLALMQFESHQPTKSLRVAQQVSTQGEKIYALGYPLDLGLTVIPGTYNGLLEHSALNRVHFSGSLNPGMSGGPAIEEGGSVVGVNVATSGNQVSFLVPIGSLHQLLKNYANRGKPVDNFKQHMTEQLLSYQARVVGALLALEWPVSKLGEAMAVEEINKFYRCWGFSNDTNKDEYTQVSRSCQSEGDIYLGSRFNTGRLEMQFFWLQADTLNSWRFYNYIESFLGNFVSGNKAQKDDVTKFVCESGLVNKADSKTVSTVAKSSFCTRAYKEYPGLYDVLFISATVDDPRRSYISHFTLSGVSRELSVAFMTKFNEVAIW